MKKKTIFFMLLCTPLYLLPVSTSLDLAITANSIERVSNTLGKCYHRFFRPLDQPGPYISRELQQALKAHLKG